MIEQKIIECAEMPAPGQQNAKHCCCYYPLAMPSFIKDAAENEK